MYPPCHAFIVVLELGGVVDRGLVGKDSAIPEALL